MQTTSSNATSIAYVMREFPVLYHAMMLNEVRMLREMGQAVRVFSLLEPAPHEYRREAGVDWPPVTYCWQARAPRWSVLQANLSILARVGPDRYRSAYALALRGGLVGNIRSFSRLAYHANELRRQGVTHFHAHWATEATTTALVFSRLTRLPFSFTAHAYDIFRSPQFLELKLREASFAVTVSQYNKHYIAEHFGPDQASKIQVVYPLVDLSQFAVRPPQQNGTMDILSVARLTECKGLIHLVEACRLLKDRGLDFTCRIVGQGPDQTLLEDAIVRYGLGARVHLLGALQHVEIPPLLNETTVFALPCVIARDGSRDGMPLVLIEAMARGVPVVTTDILGLPELVPPGAGLLVPPHDSKALADAIERIGQLSPHARDAMGQTARRVAEEFDAHKGAARMLELFRGAPGDQHSDQEKAATNVIARV